MLIFSNFDDFFSKKENMATLFFFVFLNFCTSWQYFAHKKNTAQVGWVGCIGAVIKDFPNNQ